MLELLKIKNLKEELKSIGYFGNDDLITDLKPFLDPAVKKKGVNAILVSGKPGVGKSYLPKKLAELFAVENYYVYFGDPNTGQDQLKEDYNLPAILSKNADDSIRKGPLVEAIESANQKKVTFLVLDEWDKTLLGADNFLNDFLGEGQTRTANFGVLKVLSENMEYLYVFVCKNYKRELEEQLLRRFYKDVTIKPLKPALIQEILEYEIPNVETNSLNAVLMNYRIALSIADDLSALPTAQEMYNAVQQDMFLKNDGQNDSLRLQKMVEMMIKGEDNRKLILSKLEEKGYVVDAESNDKVFSDLPLHNKKVNGQVQVMDYIEMLTERIAELEKGAFSTRNNVMISSTNPAENAESSTKLGKLTEKVFGLQGVLPYEMYDPSKVSIRLDSSVYATEKELYVIAKLRATDDTEANKMLKTILNWKTKLELEAVHHDGIVLVEDETNKISLLHLIEGPQEKITFYLVSEQPVFTFNQVLHAIYLLPGELYKCTVSPVDFYLTIDISTRKFIKRLGELKDISKDKKEIVGTVGIFDYVYYNGKSAISKVKTQKRVTLKEFEEQMFRLYGDTAVEKFNESVSNKRRRESGFQLSQMSLFQPSDRMKEITENILMEFKANK